MYDPRTARLLTFHDAAPAFLEGRDSPRAYLERCLEVIEGREPMVQAFVVLDLDGARRAADAATARYKEGRPLSRVDGLPLGVKDLYETADMPTQMGCAVFKGHQPFRDAAAVDALKRAGAVILGKTVTTELGFTQPGPTTNPFDARRTPGGSSSGSAAAIGAAMLPVAIGSQVVGSIIRPASFCGNYAIKPTLGALCKSGGHSALSHSHLGLHTGSLEDLWIVAWEIASRAGGDPGYPGLYGGPGVPEPARPGRLILMETEGWPAVEGATMAAFEGVLDWLRGSGVEILRRADHPAIEAFEQAIADSLALCRDICGYELRWPLRVYRDMGPGKLSDSMLQRLEMAETLTVEDYRRLLGKREEMRRRLADLTPLADGLISLPATGPAPPLRPAEESGRGTEEPRYATGLPAFNAATSALGAPAVTVPLLAVDGLPVGVQLVGQPHADERVVAQARWLAREWFARAA